MFRKSLGEGFCHFWFQHWIVVVEIFQETIPLVWKLEFGKKCLHSCIHFIKDCLWHCARCYTRVISAHAFASFACRFHKSTSYNMVKIVMRTIKEHMVWPVSKLFLCFYIRVLNTGKSEIYEKATFPCMFGVCRAYIFDSVILYVSIFYVCSL